jgi:hypothetical protein
VRWSLQDVEVGQKTNVRGFPIPRRFERTGLRAGDLVKLVFLLEGEVDDVAGELMWVEIEEVAADHFVGRLTNEPRYIAGLHAGDSVRFEPRHVAALVTEPIDPEAHAIVSRRVLDEDAWPNRLVREPLRENYCGWQVFSGDEPADWFRDLGNARLCRVGKLLDRFPVLESVFADATLAEYRWDPTALEYVRRD